MFAKWILSLDSVPSPLFLSQVCEKSGKCSMLCKCRLWDRRELGSRGLSPSRKAKYKMLPIFWYLFFFFLSFWVEMLPLWLVLENAVGSRHFQMINSSSIPQHSKKIKLRPFCFSPLPVVLKGARRQLPASFACHSHGEGYICILGLWERKLRQTRLCYFSSLSAAKCTQPWFKPKSTTPSRVAETRIGRRKRHKAYPWLILRKCVRLHFLRK